MELLINVFFAELPAGQISEFLVGFTNKGEQEMIVDSMEASLRYPMDFSFHLQNFSAINYVKQVKSKQQATVAYSFIPADAFAGRPIGLTINLHYRDAAGNFFIDPVFNETVQIVEFDEGFDTETFFMYVCIFGLAVLCLFLVFNYLGGERNEIFQTNHCFQIFYQIIIFKYFQARKVELDPSQLRLEPMAAMSTLSGFPRPTFALLDQGRPAHDRGKLRIQLVLTPTRDNGEVKSDPVNKDSDLQQAQTVYEYLSVNGHEIWISDFIFCLEAVLPGNLLSGFIFRMSSCFSQIMTSPVLINVIKHSVSSP